MVRLFALTFCFIAASAIARPIMPADTTYEQAWKLVEQYIEKQRPQSALEVVNGVYAKAKREKNSVNFIKAVAHKLRLQQDLKEDDVVGLIADLRKEANAASFPEKNILHAYLAKAYLGYYNGNAYLIAQRTPVALDTIPPDITLWDASTFKYVAFEEIDKSLADRERLQATPIANFRDLFASHSKEANVITSTLFDGLAANALEVYRALGRSRTFRIQNPVLDETDENFPTEGAFAPIRKFIDLSLPGDSSAARRALRLYQDLLRFHLRSGNTAALLDNDLGRLAYVHGVVHTEEGDSLYVKALENLYQEYKEKEEVAQVAERLIEILMNTDPKKAQVIADEVIRKHPRAKFAPNVRNRKRDLERAEINMVIEHSVQPGKPAIGLVRYKNIQRVWLRIVEFDGEIPNIEQQKFFQQLRRIKPVHEWEQTLPDFKDLKYHSADIKIPAIPKLGRYFVLISTDPDFNAGEHGYGMHPFWVTKLALAKFESSEDDEDRYFVHDAVSGAPIVGATVKVYSMRYNYQTSRSEKDLQKTVKTDAQGRFTVENERGRRNDREYYDGKNHVFDITTGSDRYMSDQMYSYPQPRAIDKFTPQTFFFTDRSIYRPGQTIYFKGIMIEQNPSKLDNKVLPNKRTTVKFFDANYQLIAEKDFTTNDNGSFNGSFTAPIGKLNGSMHIEDAHGNAYFRVEEYKRPTFNVTFEEITKTYKVDDSIVVKGNVKSFAGANLDNARIRYRVTRVARFPYWFDWWRPIPYGRTVTIVSGTTTTAADGSFTIGFIAKPDKTQPKSNDPLFTYEITTEVTDISGETQSGSTTVSAAYYSLISSVSVPEVIERSSGGKLVFRTLNVNGRPAASRNDVRIERLAEPAFPIRKRLWEKADTTTMPAEEFKRDFPLDEYRNESDMNTWAAAEQTLARTINLDTSGVDSLSLAGYKPGIYKVLFITHDPAGKDLRQVAFFKVYDKQSSAPSFVTPLTLSSEKTQFQPGSTASLLLSSSYEDALVFYEVTSHRGTIRSEQIRLGKAQRMIDIPVTEQDRGGITVTAYLVHDYRLYSSTVRLEVPWTNKDLTVKIETFRSKLKPGEKDEWRITLKGAKSEPVAAEMLAAMYDASLDEIEPHRWNRFVWSAFYPNINVIGLSMAPREIPFILERQDRPYEENFDYGRYILQTFGLEYLYGRGRQLMRYKNGGVASNGMATEEVAMTDGMVSGNFSVAESQVPPPASPQGGDLGGKDKEEAVPTPATTKKLDQVTARRNFNETAFFYPTLIANKDGEITFSFTVPEALTTWKMMGYAHTADLQTGYVEQSIVTQKDLMVQPNVPRFVREGDSVVLIGKISNISASDLTGDARLSFFDATTMQPYDQQVSLTNQIKQFSVAKGRSTSVSWRFVVPEGAPTLVYRIVAATDKFSDGEEAPIPVLPNKMLVTETLPLNIRGKSTETYRFDKLAASKSSPTLRNHKLTLEMSSNPAWYAIQALPTLMEFPYDCAEQVFNRFYANSIAFTLANSSPRLKQVFESWRGSKESLLSNLEKNEDLKQVLLEETPWVLDGKSESERKQRLGILFDINTMAQGLDNALNKLQEQQTPTGAWTWFPGMPESDHITQYIVAGFGKLGVMGVDLKKAQPMIERAVRYIDVAMNRRYQELKRQTKVKMDDNHLGYEAIQYLYARSFFKEQDVAKDYEIAFNYWLKQAEKYWTERSILAQSMTGTALSRFDRPKVAKEIVTSLNERALRSKELGMYWKQNYGWFWYELPIETQATAIELFDEVAKDKKAVEELKIWLLKNKQVNDWRTTTATSDACYALLGRGSDLLASTELVKITLGGKEIDPTKLPDVKVEEGTGYFRTSWHGEEIKPEMANVSLTKVDDGIAWGAVYWQYFERLDKITPAKTPLMVEKKLYRKNTVSKKIQLEEITPTTPVKVGDIVTARIAIRVDRDMEYIHLKDMRGASFEPTSQLSGFHWKGGLGYYESIKDASTNFFVHYLPKGTYVLEYDLRASHSGRYLGGITTIQSMYAPEFASHTEGISVTIAE